MKRNLTEFECTDCGFIITIPNDIEENEIVKCLGCGLEYVYEDGKLSEILLDMYDAGE